MTTISDLVDVPSPSDEQLRALADVINLCHTKIDGQQIDWRTLRRDFSDKPWKPKLGITEGVKFPYRVYAVNVDGTIEQGERYKDRHQAERGARDLAWALSNPYRQRE